MINGKISVDLYSNKVKELNISNDEVESKKNQMSLDLSKKKQCLKKNSISLRLQ